MTTSSLVHSGLRFLAAGCLLSAPPLVAQTIISTDFNTAEIKSYNDGDIIGAANDPTTQLTVRRKGNGDVPGQPAWDVKSDGWIKVVEVDGKRALEFTNNLDHMHSHVRGSLGVAKLIPEEIGKRDNLRLQGTLVLTPLAVPEVPHTEHRAGIVILVSAEDWLTTGDKTSFDFELTPTLVLRYTGGVGIGKAVPGTNQKESQILTAETKYRIDFTADYSNKQQNTWEFTLYEGDTTAKPIFTSGKLKTRNNVVPGILGFNATVGDGGLSTEPFVRIQKVSLAAVYSGQPK